MRSLRAAPVFALAVLVTLGLAGLYGLMILLMQLQPGFMGMAHFAEVSHRIHDLTFGFLFWPAIVGILAQLRRPSKNVAGMLMALIPWVGLLLAAILSADVARVILRNPSPSVAVMTVIAALLHPTGRDFFRSLSVSRINWVMVALVITAAVPLLAFASTNIDLQRTVTSPHAEMGHYGFMAAFSFTVIGVGLLASLRPDGWWLPAWVAGLLPASLGIASVVYPNVDSSVGLVWALAAIAWGVGFVAAAELTQDVERPTLLGSLRSSRDVLSIDDTGVTPTEARLPGPPRWANVFGIIVIGLVLVWTTLPLTGIRAGGLHTPPTNITEPSGRPGLHTPPLQHPSP